jgi:hypothetical protein
MQKKFIATGLAAALATTPAWAADAVTDAIQAAYAPYRTALFRTNSNAQAASEQAMAGTRQAWQNIVERFAARPPPPYDRDAGFAATLAQVGAIYAQAEEQVRGKQLTQAHATLEMARELMAELRRRNGVVTYSDHMNAYHTEMERLLGDTAALLAAPQAALQLMARAGALDVLARRLRSEAPAELRRDPEFMPLLQALEASVAALRDAALGQDPVAMRKAADMLKMPYSKLFLRFG